MPLARYFLYVGGVLLALLLISNAVLPNLPVVDGTDSSLPVIRIHSDRKWPERVVFDTNLPTITPPSTAKVEASVPPVTATVADVSAKARAQEAFAQADVKQLETAAVKKP